MHVWSCVDNRSAPFFSTDIKPQAWNIILKSDSGTGAFLRMLQKFPKQLFSVLGHSSLPNYVEF